MCLPIPTEKEVYEFKRLYEREFITQITLEEARRMATRLIQVAFVKHMEVKSKGDDNPFTAKKSPTAVCIEGAARVLGGESNLLD